MKTPLVALDAQIATIEADEKLGLHDLPRITSQQRVFVAARVGGLDVKGAAKAAGCSSVVGRQWERDETIQLYVERYQDEMSLVSLPRVKFALEDAHAMYMQAYHMSATAGEMVKATDSLVKLHRINDAPPLVTPKSTSARQLADLPLAELMRLAGLKVESLMPEPIDGEYTQG